jgi:ribosomal protein S18 acetylase RimI-like enzyme
MLIPFDIKEFSTLNRWIDSKETIELFAGYDWNYPLTEKDFSKYIKNNPSKFHFYYHTELKSNAIGFAEIITEGENTPRIGRLILNPNHRGQGHGSRFIQELIQKAKIIKPSKLVYLYVFEDNYKALKTYERLGFTVKNKLNYQVPNSKESKTLLLMSTF